MTNPVAEFYPVVIIGAGVSGSSTAIRLAQAGIPALMVDKAEFPRDTVGEGLSPAIGPFLEELGIVDEINAGPFVKKYSLQLVAPNGAKAYTHIDLTRKHYNAGIHRFPWGFNVRRKHFDMVFLNRAKALGVEVRLRTMAAQVELDSTGGVCGVMLKDEDGHVTAVRTNLIIDCSGRQSKMAQQFGLRAPLDRVFEGQWANFAVRLHFRGVNLEPLREGNPNYHPSTVNIIPDSQHWYWFIPIEEDLVSIGFVARSKMQKYFDGDADKAQVAREMIARQPLLRKVIEGAEMSDDIVFTGRLGHMNTHFSGAGWMCVGDAAFFADPAWGTGVTIALKTSKMAAENAVKAVREQNFSAEFLSEYERDFREFFRNPFNSIRAYNYYYNDLDYLNFLVTRLAQNQEDMDLIGAVLFDYVSHAEFEKWTFREFKAYVRATGKMPIMDKVSQLNFETGELSVPT